MKKYKSLIFAIIAGVISYAVYIYKIADYVFYHPDLARDLFEILKITKGDLTLIGPKLTFGGLYVGPYYFYIFSPFYAILNKEVIYIYLINILFFSLSLVYFFKKCADKYGLLKSSLATLVLTLSPILLWASRNPSNALTFLPIFIFALTYMFFNKIENKFSLLFLGFLSGIIVNFHFINIVLMPFIFLYIFYILKNKKSILYFVPTFILSFAPLILFEIKNKFVIFINTFVHKSYLAWMNATNIPGGMQAKKNIFENIVFINNQIGGLTLLPPLILFLGFGLYLIFRGQKQRENIAPYFLLLFSFILYTAVIRFQFIPHYLYGIALLILFTFIILTLRTKLWWLLALAIIVEIINFPGNIYIAQGRKPASFENAVKYVIDKNLINKNDSFNVIQITKEQLLATLGFEYRFFLLKHGYKANNEFQYPASNKLIVFSELKDMDISKYSSWEAEQFGKEHFKNAKKYNADNLTIYVAEK